MKFTYRFHAWLGLLTGVVMLVICVTGSIAVFKPEIDRAVDPAMRDMPDIPAEGDRVSLDDVWKNVAAAYPEGTPTAVWLPAHHGTMFTHGRAMSVWMRAKRPHPTEVLVHPFTGEILGARRRLDGWGQWIREFHKALFYGFWGRVFVGAFGVLLIVSTVTGLMMFRRFNRGSWWPKIRWDRGGRILLADLHKTVGLWSAALCLVLALTGAVVGLENLYHRYWKEPGERLAVPEPGPAKEGILEDSLARAKEVFPRATPVRVVVPRDERPLAIVTMEHPVHELVGELKSYVRFNATTGELMDMYDAAEAGLGARLYYAMEPLHFGRLGGSMTVKVIYAVVGVLIGLLCISGYVIFLLRKFKTKRPRRAKQVGSASAATTARGAEAEQGELVAARSTTAFGDGAGGGLRFYHPRNEGTD